MIVMNFNKILTKSNDRNCWVPSTHSIYPNGDPLHLRAEIIH